MTHLEQKIDGYCIKVPGGQYIGIDHSSGGYPYLCAKHGYFPQTFLEEDAENYKRILNYGSSFGDVGNPASWRVVHIVIMEIE